MVNAVVADADRSDFTSLGGFDEGLPLNVVKVSDYSSSVHVNE